MISLTNYGFQWGRSEVVIKFTQIQWPQLGGIPGIVSLRHWAPRVAACPAAKSAHAATAGPSDRRWSRRCSWWRWVKGPWYREGGEPRIPSGELTWQWKITILNGKIHYKWPFSIAMLVYQRVGKMDNQKWLFITKDILWVLINKHEKLDIFILTFS